MFSVFLSMKKAEKPLLATNNISSLDKKCPIFPFQRLFSRLTSFRIWCIFPAVFSNHLTLQEQQQLLLESFGDDDEERELKLLQLSQMCAVGVDFD